MSTTYQELLAEKLALDKQVAEIENQLAQARQVERSAVIANIKELLSKNGLSVSDLGLKTTGELKGRGPAKGKSVPPKYQNASTGQTWSGRGIKPKWVAEALAAGKSLDDLKI